MQDKWLIHTTLEGPENAVYYRGNGILRAGWAEIHLPDYFEDLTDEKERTILVTSIFENEEDPVSGLAASQIRNGVFFVKATDNKNSNQKFSWEVKAIRKDVSRLFVDPDKSQVNVHGTGPYKFYSIRK